MTDYLAEGVEFLASRRFALLGDEPGVGKCRQVIEAANRLGIQRILIIAPAVARFHWQREWEKWRNDLSLPVVLSYNEAADRACWQSAAKWDLLIIDESHYAKNPLAARTHAVFGRGGIVHHAKRIWCVTGTPTPNGLASELWVLLYCFGATGLDYASFTERFCVFDNEGRIRGNRAERMLELREMLAPYVLRRRAKDVMDVKIDVQEYSVAPSKDWLDLMGVTNLDITGERTTQQATAEETKLRELLKAATNDAQILEALRSGSRDFMATYRRYLALLKAPSTYDLIKFELENDLVQKFVVFGYHITPMRVMADKARRDGFNPEFIYGGTPAQTRDRAITRFGRKGCHVMFCNMVAAGIAVDLSAAHEGIMLELDWTPAVNAQALLRMRRRSQEHPVRVRVMVAANTLDEVISGVNVRKLRETSAIWEKKNDECHAPIQPLRQERA